MSSSEDMFLDLSQSPPSKSTNSPMESSPSSSLLVAISGVTPGSPSPTPPAVSQINPSPTSPTPPSPLDSQPINLGHEEQNFNILPDSLINEAFVKEIKIEFYDDNGTRIRQTRFSQDIEIIDIVSSLIRAKEPQKNAATVSKLCESDLFKRPLQKQVLQNFSQAFSEYVSSEKCPLNNKYLFMDFEDLMNVDLTKIIDECLSEANEVFSAVCFLCFGVDLNNIQDHKHVKQRLTAVLSIAAFSRNQKTNTVQKILGEYFKLNNTGKQALQLLQRLGLTLVPKSVRENQDRIGTHFLHEVEDRKKEIEIWHHQRNVLESLVKKEI